jgi:hypothetical protein
VTRLAGVVQARRYGRLDSSIHVVRAEQDERIGADEFQEDLLQVPAGESPLGKKMGLAAPE